jgi:hypothetical protein
MKEKFWDVYDGIGAFFRDLRSEYRNRLIRHCLRHICLDSGTARMMVHKLSKGEIQYYLAEYDECEAYWQKHGSPFDK